MFASVKSWLFAIRLHHVALMLIVLLGLWLRLHNLSQTMWFFDGMDEARDVMVAKHIVEYGEVIWRGPFAAGGYFWLQNSPFYYYFLAGIWFFGRSAISSLVIWAGISSTGILLSYWAGKLTRSTSVGLMAALLYAVHPSLIVAGNQIMQPHLLPLCALWFYCSTVTAWKEKSPGWLMVAGFWLLFPIHFHYGSLLLWPVGGLALAISWYVASKQNWSYWLVYLGYSLLLSLNIMLFWVFLTYKYEPFDQLHFFTLNKGRAADPFLIKLTETGTNFKSMVLGFIPDWVAITASVGLFVGWLLSRKKQAEYLLLALLLSAGISLIFKSYIAATYMLASLPFWVILWACVIHTSFKLRWWLGFGIVALTGWWWRDMTWLARNDLPQHSYYQQYQTATITIYQDYLSLAPSSTSLPPRFTVAELASYTGIQFDGWRVGPFWYFLEDLTQQRLITLVDWDTNLSSLATDYDYLYLVCDRRDKPEKAWNMCYEAFTKKRDYIDGGVQISGDQPLLIWRFTIDQAKKPERIYRMYPEYM
jgi:hypothetical protein